MIFNRLNYVLKITFIAVSFWSGLLHAAKPVQDYEIGRTQYEIDIHDEQGLAYSQTVTRNFKVLTSAGAEYLQKHIYSYYSENETISILEASVETPDGKIIPVEKDNIYEHDLGGRDDDNKRVRKLFIVFSRLTAGSRISLKHHHEVHRLGPAGVNFKFTPSLGVKQGDVSINILLPEKTPIQWGERGGYVIVSKEKGGRKALEVSFSGMPYIEGENNMVSPDDVLPMFVLSSFRSWEGIGKLYHDNSLDQHSSTQEIKDLADDIAGNADTTSGIAKSIYTWVAQNINYMSKSLNLKDTYTPNTVESIIRHGYGDCKDQVLLMQVLLEAKGIESVPALIHWGDSYRDYPVATASQFNHAVLFIPELNVFLNPVTPYTPFGQLDGSLTNKRVVLATKEGKTFMVSETSSESNSYRAESYMKLSDDGGLTGNTSVTGIGVVGLHIRELLASEGSGEAKANEILLNTVAGGFGDIDQASDPYDLMNPKAGYSGQWHSPKAFNLGQYGFITTTGGIDPKRVLLLRNLLVDKERRFPLLVGTLDYQWVYSIELPVNYDLAFKPENAQFSNAAGEYTSQYSLAGGVLHVVRQLVIRQQIFSPKEYPDFEQLIYTAISDLRAVTGLKIKERPISEKM